MLMSRTPRPARFTILAVAGLTALSVAACGSSNNAKPTSSSTPTSAGAASPAPGAQAKGKDFVSGMIASVSGNAAQVTQQTGPATVDFSPSTKVTEITAASLTDVTAGRCVSALPAREATPAAGGPVTAQLVRLSAPVDGKCPQVKPPAAGKSTPAPSPGPAPAAPRVVRGTVASVAGNTITVTDTDANGNPSQTTVTVTDQTKYTQSAVATIQAITQGKCLAARGTKDSGGALQATMIHLQPADNGNCPQLGGGKRPGG
jgi:hypothetical protein